MKGFEFKDIDGEYTLVWYSGGAQSVQIPSFYNGRVVTAIGSHAFMVASATTEVIIPPTITRIERFAFKGCHVKSLIIPDSVTEIEREAFSGCWMEHVVLPTSIDRIEKGTFQQCFMLKSVTIPPFVTSIERFAFFCCNNLEDVTIPSSVTSIAGSAFGSCGNLKKAFFENPYGWYLQNSLFFSKEYSFARDDLEHPPTAAKLLTKVYSYNAYWKRK